MPYIEAPTSLIDEWSFEFEEIKVPAVSAAGSPYLRGQWVGMPAIGNDVLDCVFYLYASRSDAERGENAGGTGFFFCIEFDGGPGEYYYAVTNWHVAVRDGFPVIRVNTKDGGADFFELDSHDWVFKPQWYDIAIADVTLDPERHKVTFVGSQMAARLSDLGKYDIGLGDDIFMIGRFMDHDGGAVNVPSARFGNIAVMPQPIPQPTGAKDLPSYVLDVHSRNGYSGSPVFVFHSQTQTSKGGTLSVVAGSRLVKLLGVHWGQFPERWEIKERQESRVRRGPGAQTSSDPSANVQYVQGFSGMTLAIPADAIMELLDVPKLKEPRDRAFDEARRAHQNDPVAESEPPTKEGNPRHREDFNSLLNAAVQSQKPGDQT